MRYGSKVKRETPEGMRRRKVTHKIRMKTNNKQSTYLWGVWQYTKQCYNYALGYHKLTVKMKRACFKLRPWINRIKKHRFPWGEKLPKIPGKNAVYNLECCLAQFYTKRKNGDKSQGYPRFKNNKTKPSLRIDNGRGRVPIFKGKKMYLGTSWAYKEWNLEESFRFPEGEICQVVIVQELRDQWYVCVTAEILEKIPETPKENIGKSAGGDHGIGDTVFAYADDEVEKTYKNPRFFRKSEDEIAQLDREIARSLKQNNQTMTTTNKERQTKRQKLHLKVKNQRNDFNHKMTTEIVNRHTDRLVIESPNANAWARHPKLAKSTHDAAPGDITSKLRYKCEAAGKELVEADRHYASTRTCSNLKCGWFWRDMGLSDRMFICQQCGLLLDRDINAARNLKQWNKNTEHSPSLGGDPRDGKNFDESSNPASDKPRPQSKVLVSAKASQDSAISLA